MTNAEQKIVDQYDQLNSAIITNLLELEKLMKNPAFAKLIEKFEDPADLTNSKGEEVAMYGDYRSYLQGLLAVLKLEVAIQDAKRRLILSEQKA